MAGAFITAIVFVITMSLSLPKTDGAYGRDPFADPFVGPIASMGAGLAGVIVFPFVYIILRNRRIVYCAKIVFPVVLLSTIAFTAINIMAGLCGSFLSLGVALTICSIAVKKDNTPNQASHDTVAPAGATSGEG